MRSLWSLLVLVLFGSLLAGCLGGDDAIETDQDEDGTAEGTGRVTGRIFTTDLIEVANARVVLSDGTDLVAETTTDNDGTYRLENIEPGDYRIQVTAPCCRENVRAISVKAGEATPVDLQLEPFTQADLQAPFVEEYEWSGFLACGYSLVILAGDGCADVDDQADRAHPFELGVGIKTLTAVLVWDATGGVLGEELQYGLAQHPCEHGSTPGGCATPPDYYGQSVGSSPLYLRIDGGSPQSFEDIEEPASVQLRVWPPFGSPDLFYQQQFTIHYHLHFHQAAPEGYDPLPDL